MTKKPKQSKKGAKHSKRIKVAAEPEDEPDTATTFLPAETPESIQVSPQTEAAEVPVESLQAAEVTALAIQSTESEAAPKTTRSETAKANIKEGLRLHQIAGRPTKAQLILVFGQGLFVDLAKKNRTVWHHAGNFPGCCGCTLGPSRQAYCGETKRESVRLLFTLALYLVPRFAGRDRKVRQAARGNFLLVHNTDGMLRIKRRIAKVKKILDSRISRNYPILKYIFFCFLGGAP
jgi:hypothetical protein